jgi:hypothetical protein
VTFIPELFTLTISGSYTYTDNSATDDSSSLMVNGNLNFFMSKLFKYKVQPSLSLRTKYQQSEFGGMSSDSFSIYLAADISF